MNVKGFLIDTIASVYPDYPMRLQGSISDEEEYPEHFFTFFNNDTTGTKFYDNAENAIIWDFDLNFYSVDPLLVDTVFASIKPALENAGWIVDGFGYDVPSGEPTHTGRGCNLLYIEKHNAGG